MMKQKPILFLLFFAFIATGISQRQGYQPLPVKKSGGGTHPKNVSLAITCPNGVFVHVRQQSLHRHPPLPVILHLCPTA